MYSIYWALTGKFDEIMIIFLGNAQSLENTITAKYHSIMNINANDTSTCKDSLPLFLSHTIHVPRLFQSFKLLLIWWFQLMPKKTKKKGLQVHRWRGKLWISVYTYTPIYI